MKKVLSIILWSITGIALVALFILGRKWYLETPLKGVVFHLDRSNGNGFVEKDSVIAYTEAICDLQHQASIASIDLMKIERLLNNNPWIETSSAFIGLNDTLTIKAIEHQPVLRVYNQEGRSMYVTKEGILFPTSPDFTPRIIIANGNYDFPTSKGNAKISDTLYAASGIEETLAIAMALQKDDFLNSSIGQIYRNQNNQYELSVNNLSAKVILGDTIAVDRKLARLKSLIEKYSGTEELTGYKTLDLRYNNQIVCTKK